MIKIWICFRCGHEWASRQPDKPKSCSRCKAANWWRVARKPAARLNHRRTRLYPLDVLRVGDSILLPWWRDSTGELDTRRNRNIYSCVNQYAAKHGVKLSMVRSAAGVRVTRDAQRIEKKNAYASSQSEGGPGFRPRTHNRPRLRVSPNIYIFLLGRWPTIRLGWQSGPGDSLNFFR